MPRFSELFAVRAGNVSLDAHGSVAVHFADRFPGWSSLAVHFPDLLEDCGLRLLNVPFSFLWPYFVLLFFSLAWRYFLHVDRISKTKKQTNTFISMSLLVGSGMASSEARDCVWKGT